MITKPPARAAAWDAASIDWQDIGRDGTRYALLEGDRSTTGQPFSYAFFIPKGFWDPAHWHTADARIYVAKGTLYLGYGDVHDDRAIVAYSGGSYVIVPAGARHFDGSFEDTVIFGTAIGPWATHYVDPAHRPSAGTPPLPAG